MVNFLCAELTNIVLIMLILFEQQKNKKKYNYLLRAYILGCLVVIPCGLLELFFSIGGNNGDYNLSTMIWIGPIEEFIKLLIACLVIRSVCRKNLFANNFDGIIYSVMVAVGFSFVENLFYALPNISQKTALGRSLVSSPEHAIYGAILGASASKYRELSLNGKKVKGFLYVAFGFAIAAILHSAADSMIFVAGTSIPKIFHVIVIVSGILFVVDQYKKMKHRTTHGVR